VEICVDLPLLSSACAFLVGNIVTSIKVIVIEDQPEDAEIISLALTRSGVDPKILVLGSKADALHFFEHDKVAHHLVDLVVVDLNLGDGFGDELLPMIRERVAAKTPIMILTGSFERASMDRCIQLGANACFVKPARSDELSSIFHNFIRDQLGHALKGDIP
jgi:DNA-binding response OmpR family regulator